MSEELEPVFAQWDAGNETGDPTVANERQFAALRTAIGYAEEFTLLIALCDRNDLRREMMRRIHAELSSIPFLDIPLTEPVENLYHTLRQELAKPDAKAAKAVMAWGLEVWLPAGFDAENSPFVKNLNAARNHFPTVLRGPLVLWLSTHHLDAIARGAPDFWSVRSGVYVFAAGQEEHQTARETLQLLGLRGVAGLSLDDKMRRLSELETMLREMVREPNAERDLTRELRLREAAAETYYALAMYDKAEPELKRILELDEELYGPDHPNVGSDLNNLALLFQETNRLAEAETLIRRALHITEKTLGSSHPEVGTRLNNLGALLRATNRSDEAEPVLRRALEIGETNLGPGHPKIAISLSNLALLLRDSNRLSEVEPLLRRALSITEAAVGPEHPTLAPRLNNLASYLQDANRLDEAEKLYRRAIGISEKSMGHDHPDVSMGLNNLAMLLAATNRTSEAEPLFRRALDIAERVFGPNHPYVAIRLNNLASFLLRSNRLAEAEPLARRALDIDERSLGNHHPSVANRLYNLALIELAKGDSREARRHLERASLILQSTLGDQHPHTRLVRRRLADVDEQGVETRL